MVLKPCQHVILKHSFIIHVFETLSSGLCFVLRVLCAFCVSMIYIIHGFKSLSTWNIKAQYTIEIPRNTAYNPMIYITFFIVILIDKRDDKKEQLTEGTDTSTVIGTSTRYRLRYQVQGTRDKYRYQIQRQV